MNNNVERNNEVWGLCAGRHEMPVDKFIFDEPITDPTDVGTLLSTVTGKMLGYKNNGTLTVYVTGLTVALGAVVTYCIVHGIRLFLYHYDAKTGKYFEQCLPCNWYFRETEEPTNDDEEIIIFS